MLPKEAFSTDTCPATFSIDKIDVNVLTQLCIQLKDADGCPVNIWALKEGTECKLPEPPNPGAPDWDPSQWEDEMFGGGEEDPEEGEPGEGEPEEDPATTPEQEMPEGWVAAYRIKEMLSSTRILASTVAEAIDASKGFFSVQITPNFIDMPGVFIAELAIYDDEDNLRAVDKRYMSVSPNLSQSPRGMRALTIPDIRMALWDICPEQNTLLDDFEFDDASIIYAINRPIDQWNETPPSINTFSPNTFPYREHWLKAVCGYLLKTAAHKFRRNALPYQAAGLSVNAQNKFNEYDAAGRELLDEYRHWLMAKKVELNMNRGYGIFSSPY